jgi:hypothetical protein
MTSTPRVSFPDLTRTGCGEKQVISAPSERTLGLCPVSRYTPAGNESMNLPLLPTVTVNLCPAEFLAVTWPGTGLGEPGAGPPTVTKLPVTEPRASLGDAALNEYRMVLATMPFPAKPMETNTGFERPGTVTLRTRIE